MTPDLDTQTPVMTPDLDTQTPVMTPGLDAPCYLLRVLTACLAWLRASFWSSPPATYRKPSITATHWLKLFAGSWTTPRQSTDLPAESPLGERRPPADGEQRLLPGPDLRVSGLQGVLLEGQQVVVHGVHQQAVAVRVHHHAGHRLDLAHQLTGGDRLKADEVGDLLQGQLGEERRVRELHKVLQDEAARGVAHRRQAVGGGDVPDVDAGLHVELRQQEVRAHLEQLRDLQGDGGRGGAADGVQGHVDAAQVGEGDDIGQACRRRGDV
ncbi:hypothetical protein EYF80_037861 [Liparis tanakae]|uniref:Uncharacterized protein n=1 Tax=Liparis tanakae TaxID=230148 RepID=A0A4Z2GGU2_9TELE|nr:hypothetical protein EYF80_037861 [Liparis tanakae]